MPGPRLACGRHEDGTIDCYGPEQPCPSDQERFAKKLEASVLTTIESGTVTKDLAAICQPPVSGHTTTEGFIDAIAERLKTKIDSMATAS